MKRLTAAIALTLLIAFAGNAGASAATQKWVCKPGWGNWEHKTIEHEGYTTYYPMWVGKIMIMQPMIHQPYTEHKWTCKNYIHAENFHKYYDDGKLRPEFKDFDEWAKERKQHEKNKDSTR